MNGVFPSIAVTPDNDQCPCRVPCSCRCGPPIPSPRRRPSTFGLSYAELWAEVARLQAQGWSAWEITERFDLSPRRALWVVRG